MILEILWKAFSAVKSFLEFSVGYVSCHHDGSIEAKPCGDRILGEYLQDFRNWLVEVDLDGVAFSGLAEFFRNQS